MQVARLLNRAGVSAAPVESLGALSIFADEEYENYDLDIIGPRQRRRLIAALTAVGFEHRSGRELARGDVLLRFPRSKRTLGTDPTLEASEVVGAGAIALLTPTQTALLLLREDPDAPLLESQLGDLAYEQPLNLDKVAQWARTTGHAGHFARVRQHVERRQREGVRLRRRGRFVSALPT